MAQPFDLVLKHKAKQQEFRDKAKTELPGLQNIASDALSLFQLFSEIPDNLRGAIEGRTKGTFAKFFKTDPKLNAYEDLRGLIMANISRQLGGERGVLTDRDIKRIEDAFPSRIDTNDIAFEKITGMLRFMDARVKSKQFEAGVNPMGLGMDIERISRDYAGASEQQQQAAGRQQQQSTSQPTTSVNDYLNTMGF